MFELEKNRLIYRFAGEKLWLEPWGKNALRVRATKKSRMPEDEWALDEKPSQFQAIIKANDNQASIQNGKIKAVVSRRGKIMIYNENKLILEEYARHRLDLEDPKCSALNVEAREFKPNLGGEFKLTLRLESLSRHEKIYGMGQYQHEYLDLKGMELELAQRNSQASVPFMLSSLGYGLLWNNPSIGRATLGANVISFEASATEKLDYWIVAGSKPKEICEGYTAVTGRPPMMPEYGLGFWQSKLRYQTQEEVLAVAREYKRRKLPIDVLVIDFFHWPFQGEWKFDTDYFPDPRAMMREIKELGIEVMISIWPQVDKKSENFEEMHEKGYLIRVERGISTAHDFQGETVHFDATNPEARAYVWDKVKENYGSLGIRLFWLDEAEPEYTAYDFDNYRYHFGPNLQVGNIYPRDYARAFYEGQTAAGQDKVVNLIRCAWAGSQKYGALVWSGDIASSWESLRCQVVAGLNMGVAGISYWTTDIGGFHGGNPDDEAFRELLVRWFQWGCFLPVFRLHGDRLPAKEPLGSSGGGKCPSGAANEVWSYGEKAGAILEKYLHIRESMRDYIRGLMRQASENGTPVIRALFFEYPDDIEAWEVEDQYLFGDKYLVAPVLHAGASKRRVYFPGTKDVRWKAIEGDAEFGGGQWDTVGAPLESMPVFKKVA